MANEWGKKARSPLLFTKGAEDTVILELKKSDLSNWYGRGYHRQHKAGLRAAGGLTAEQVPELRVLENATLTLWEYHVSAIPFIILYNPA